MALKFKKTQVNPPVVETTGETVAGSETSAPPEEIASSYEPTTTATGVEGLQHVAVGTTGAPDPFDVAARIRAALLALDLPDRCRLLFEYEQGGERFWISIKDAA